jgi:translation initiation factor 2 gamma subunit (eIF-2gamma)
MRFPTTRRRYQNMKAYATSLEKKKQIEKAITPGTLIAVNIEIDG